MSNEPLNREQRRHPDQTEPPHIPEQQMRETGRPQETVDPRAKNSGHGKKTADKWNQ